jgi:YggT family protein
MDVLLIPFLKLFLAVLNLYSWGIIIHGLLSLMIAFQILNPYNGVVGFVFSALSQITEPIYRPIRQFLPINSSIDFAPLVVLLIIYFLQNVIYQLLARGMVLGS